MEQQWLEKLESDMESDNDDNTNTNTNANTNTNDDKYKIYYKDGMNYDNCLIANSAKRAEVRRKKKEGITITIIII